MDRFSLDEETARTYVETTLGLQPAQLITVRDSRDGPGCPIFDKVKAADNPAPMLGVLE